jgi:Tfp pilus assembly pilus retraction ATPase PilT
MEYTMKRLGEILVDRGLVSKEKLAAALLEQTVTKERIGKILVRNGFLRQDMLLELLREIDPNSLHEEAVFQNLVPNDVLIATRTMISAQVKSAMYLSTLSSPAMVRRKLAPFVGDLKVVFTPANPVRINEYLTGLRSQRQDEGFTWERIFYDAMRLQASDIHVLPRSKSYTVMLRRDGVLHLHHEGSLDENTAMVSRVKDLAKMDMAERRRPQDGGFDMEFSGRIVKFRVVTVPTVDGERMVVRILDPDAVQHKLDDLGITRLIEWRRAVARPDGLCIVCGPTGSGKTTTLGASLREMNFLERALWTVEDPVENNIPYAGQVNVNNALNLGFAESVRTFMRADPDVIAVGEVRDEITARNALKAAETGHLVLATMHTGSITGAIGRLSHIGIEAHELLSLLRGVLVQRLMRKLCVRCSGAGCVHCKGAGYKGRTVISEVASFAAEEDVQGVLDGKISWPLLIDDARGKVAAGITDAAEFLRVFGVPYESEDRVAPIDPPENALSALLDDELFDEPADQVALEPAPEIELSSMQDDELPRQPE